MGKNYSSPSEKSNRGISWITVFAGSGDNLGYMNVSENLIKRLVKRGIDVRCPDDDYRWCKDRELREIYERPYIQYDDCFFVTTAANELFIDMMLKYYDYRKILLTMWEYDRVPEVFADNCLLMDEIIAPSKYNVKTFNEYIKGKQIHYCPLSYNKEIFKFRERTVDGNFRFLINCAPSVRKGWYFVAKAFEKAFRPYEPVELYIKTSPNPDSEIEGIHKIFPKVTFDCRLVSNEELADIYYASHAFVFPSLGEGFGLTCLEAIASGLVTISTEYTGLGDFINPKTAVTIKCNKKNIEFEGGWSTDVMFPYIDDIAYKMRTVYEKYGEIYPRLFPYASNWVDEQFDWEKSADIVEGIVFNGRS